MTGSQRNRSNDRTRILVLCTLITMVVSEYFLVQPGNVAISAAGLTASIDPSQQRALVNAAPSAEAYSSIITKDLFAQSREAPPGALVRMAPPKAAGDSSGMRVIGIVTSGDERLAIIGSDTAEPQSVRVGDAIAGSTVSQITPNYVVLQNNGLERILTVEHQAQGGEPQSPAMIVSNADAPTSSAPDPNSAFERAAQAAVDEFLEGRQTDAFGPEPMTSNPSSGH